MAQRRPTAKLQDPSNLPGSYLTRVFLGGSYRTFALPPSGGTAPATAPSPAQMLGFIRAVIAAERFDPILAAEFRVANPDKEIHHDALYLLHACRLSVFDLSEFSGALMEIERAADYGTMCLILFDDPAASGWKVSRMLSLFVEEHQDRFRLHGHSDPIDAQSAARNWLREMRRRGHV